MLASSDLRVFVLSIVGLLASVWPWHVDQWLWRGVRNWVPVASPVPAIVTWFATIAAHAAAAWLPRTSVSIPVRRPLVMFLVAAASSALFWYGRVHEWGGDYHGLDTHHEYFRFVRLETSAPLGTVFSTFWIRTFAAWGWKYSDAAQLETVVFGTFALLCLFQWSLRDGAGWLVRLLLVVSGGWIVMFFGYVEKGTPKMLAVVCAYVLATTRYFEHPTRWRLTLATFTLALATAVHGAAAFWLPGHFWVV